MRIKKQSDNSLFLFILLCVLVVTFFITKNSLGINSAIGNFYYLKHNYQKAQEYYEKVIKSNSKDYRLREKYFDTLTKSKMNIATQEKLAFLAEDNVNDAVTLKAQNYLEEYKQQLHEKLPSNYIKQAPSGKDIIRWDKFPITYGFSDAQYVPEYYKEEIKNAFSEWQKSGIVSFKEVSSNPNIEIKFKQNSVDIKEYGVKYVVAYTEHNVSDNVLQKMIICFYDKNADNVYFSQNQIYNTALHEIFHALGFIGHSYDKNDIMYASKDSQSVRDDIRASLSQKDINTLRILYAIKPDITNEYTTESKYVPSIVLGDDYEINKAKIIEAKNYIKNAPTLAGGYIDMAESLSAKKEYTLAIKYLERALELARTDKERHMIFYNLAVMYYYTEIPDLAHKYLDMAKEIKDVEEIHQLRAEIYMQQKDFENGIKEYGSLMKNNPNNIEFAISLANIYVEKHNYLAARKILKEFLKNNPQEKNNSRISSYGILLF